MLLRPITPAAILGLLLKMESMSIRQKQFGKLGFVDSAKVAESTLQFGNAFKNHIRFGKIVFLILNEHWEKWEH